MVLRDCAGMPYTKRIEIRWRDMDGFGHVNNAVYLTYLEEARDEFYTQLLGHDTVGRMVARRVEIDFLSGLVQDDDEVDVELEVTRIGSSSVTTSERLIAVSDGRVAARSETVMVHTDDERANAAPLPEEARRLLEGVAAA
jgi:acyl-CoA thioester hydrolase